MVIGVINNIQRVGVKVLQSTAQRGLCEQKFRDHTTISNNRLRLELARKFRYKPEIFWIQE